MRCFYQLIREGQQLTADDETAASAADGVRSDRGAFSTLHPKAGTSLAGDHFFRTFSSNIGNEHIYKRVSYLYISYITPQNATHHPQKFSFSFLFSIQFKFYNREKNT
jgi:hypothetical protein